jgi:hypothetical protein
VKHVNTLYGKMQVFNIIQAVNIVTTVLLIAKEYLMNEIPMQEKSCLKEYSGTVCWNRDVNGQVKWGKVYNSLYAHRMKEWGTVPTDVFIPVDSNKLADRSDCVFVGGKIVMKIF